MNKTNIIIIVLSICMILLACFCAMQNDRINKLEEETQNIYELFILLSEYNENNLEMWEIQMDINSNVLTLLR